MVQLSSYPLTTSCNVTRLSGCSVEPIRKARNYRAYDLFYPERLVVAEYAGIGAMAPNPERARQEDADQARRLASCLICLRVRASR